MRKFTSVLLAAGLVLGASACGGDDDEAADPTTTVGEDAGFDDDDLDAAAALLGEDCQFLLAGAFLNPLATIGSGVDADVEASAEQLEAIAAKAPPEIRDAMRTLSEAFARFAEAIEGVDMSDPEAFADPDFQAAMAEMESVFGEEYEAAGQAVGDYIDANCSGG